MSDVRTIREIRHFHLFCGLGGGGKGFNRGKARVGSMEAKFRCIGGVDVDLGSLNDFRHLVGTGATHLDMFDRQQYVAFHGHEPPPHWREATPADIQRAAGNERPHMVFLSAPCKGFSGLLAESKSHTEKYQALNRLTVRGIYLMLEAWADDPPELIAFENVPRLAKRGRALLDQIVAMLHHYGYAVAETAHDCGELGGLAQSRKRFFLMARHMAKVPPFLYEPEKRPLRAVGDILGRMPLPGDPRGGPMHRIPKLQWKTWVRLAFVEAGSDWRSLNKLAIEDGKLRDYLIVPEFHNGFNGVRRWDLPTGTITSKSRPSNGAFAVADPRFDDRGGDYGQYGVCGWDETMGSIINVKSPGQGKFAVQDPRMPPKENRQNGMYRIAAWDRAALTITGAGHVAGCAQSVADPRSPLKSDGRGSNKYRVTRFDEPSGAVIAASSSGDGAFAVADPRPGMSRKKGDAYLTGGHYGVIPWQESCGAVSAAASHDNGRWSVADPRLPEANEKMVAMIQSLDGTWHRPFTTLELAALQSLIEPEEYLELDGLSDGAWRERIGNAVPPDAAAAMASVMGTTLLLAWSGQTFALSAMPIWVQPMSIALAVDMPANILPSERDSL